MNMLQGAPWLLAHRAMLKSNQPMKVLLQGKDYVLWLDSMGNINCLPNACPHMGAMLWEGWCVTNRDGNSAVVCPFHALEFDGAGCTTIPGSNKPTKSLIKPLELMVQGEFIWSYGGCEPKIPIPNIMNEIAAEYEFIGFCDRSIKTDFLTLLLNMHDYNHQNGTHCKLFEIEKVELKQFIDDGFHSHAYVEQPRKNPKLGDIIKNPALLIMPKVLEAHLENFFPCMAVMHGESPIFTLKECHFYIPESPKHSRVFILMFMKAYIPIPHFIKQSLLRLVEIVLEQDADILGKLYPDAPQHIKLNNEVGMDWVQRNFESFPKVVEPNLSR